MTDLYTSIMLPGCDNPGWMELGESTRAAMIARIKEMAARDKAQAEEILAAGDRDFSVKLVRGCIVQRFVKNL